MRRVFAVLGAAAMIVGSLAIRSRLDAGDGSGGSTPSGGVRLTCSTDVAAACAALGTGATTTVEPAGVTADRLAGVQPGADPGLDGWLVPDPWPQIVNERRRVATLPSLLTVEGQPLARSPLRLVVSKARGAALASTCQGEVTWKCLGQAAADGYWARAGHPEWGPIKPGHTEPGTDGIGLLVLGQAASSYFGRADLSTIDLDNDEFQRWFSALERAVPAPAPGSSPLTQLLTTNAAAYDAVGTVEAEVIRLVGSAGDPRVDLLYPSPMATADIVLATAGTPSTAKSVRRTAGGDDVRRALAEQGWQLPAPAQPDGLPSAGFLYQLQLRWHGETGR